MPNPYGPSESGVMSFVGPKSPVVKGSLLSSICCMGQRFDALRVFDVWLLLPVLKMLFFATVFDRVGRIAWPLWPSTRRESLAAVNRFARAGPLCTDAIV